MQEPPIASGVFVKHPFILLCSRQSNHSASVAQYASTSGARSAREWALHAGKTCKEMGDEEDAELLRRNIGNQCLTRIQKIVLNPEPFALKVTRTSKNAKIARFPFYLKKGAACCFSVKSASSATAVCLTRFDSLLCLVTLTLWLCTGLCGGVWPDDVKDASGKLDPNMFFRTPCFGCQMQWINGFLNNSFRLLDYGDPQNPCYGRKFEGLYDHIQ